MRCRECNVDLPDNYTACPLCGAKTVQDTPTIGGIRYSEFPKVKTQRYFPNPFPIFLALWLAISVVGFALMRANVLNAVHASAIFCAVPLLWTLIGRPLFVRQLYVGNFAVMNIWPLMLASFVFGKADGAQADGFAFAVPLCCLVVLVALFIIVFAVPRHAKRAAPYAVLFGIGSVAAIVAVALKAKIFAPLWLAVIALSVLMLAFLLFWYKQDTKEELKAKFSIQ